MDTAFLNLRIKLEFVTKTSDPNHRPIEQEEPTFLKEPIYPLENSHLLASTRVYTK